MASQGAQVQRQFVYASEVPFPQEIQHTLVTYCADPWYREAVAEFLSKFLHLAQYDQLVAPMGAAVFLQSSLSFSTDRKRLELLQSKHELRRIIGIAHLNCSGYKVRYPSLDDAARRSKQESDLIDFRTLIHKARPHVEVELYYAQEAQGAVSFIQLR